MPPKAPLELISLRGPIFQKSFLSWRTESSLSLVSWSRNTWGEEKEIHRGIESFFPYLSIPYSYMRLDSLFTRGFPPPPPLEGIELPVPLIPFWSLLKEESKVDWSPNYFSLSTISSLFPRLGFLPSFFHNKLSGDLSPVLHSILLEILLP